MKTHRDIETARTKGNNADEHGFILHRTQARFDLGKELLLACASLTCIISKIMLGPLSASELTATENNEKIACKERAEIRNAA
eukprot:709020-Rhodomonas_salina.1